MNQRRDPRFASDLVTLFAAEEREGSGILSEISYCGARLEKTSLRPQVGSLVTLHVMVPPVAPFSLQSHVARQTETGFAIHTDVFDGAVRRLVDDVSAIVHAPSTQSA